MKLVDYVLDGPEQRLEAWLLRNLQSADSARLRTGFLTANGLQSLEIGLVHFLKSGGKLTWTVGGSPLQYEVSALEMLLALEQRFPAQVETAVVFPPAFQNAKTSLLHHKDGTWSAWIGSANVTHGGMVSNYETAVVLDSMADDDEVVSKMLDATIELTTSECTRRLDRRSLRQLELGIVDARMRPGRDSISPPRRADDLIRDAVDRLDLVASNGPEVARISTGLQDLDDVLGGGLDGGALTLIAGRAGIGCSAVAHTIVRSAALGRSIPTALYAFDMLERDVMDRILSAEARVRLSDIRSGTMTDRDWARLADIVAAIADSRLYVEAGSDVQVDALIAALTEAAQTNELRLIVIDSITSIVSRSFANTRERELAEVGKRLKSLAMDLEVSIVACAELGRSIEYRTDKRPRTSDLGDGYLLAHSSDTVILVDRPDHYERDDPRAGEVDLYVTKNRRGPEATVPAAHQLHYCRVADLARP